MCWLPGEWEKGSLGRMHEGKEETTHKAKSIKEGQALDKSALTAVLHEKSSFGPEINLQSNDLLPWGIYLQHFIKGAGRVMRYSDFLEIVVRDKGVA